MKYPTLPRKLRLALITIGLLGMFVSGLFLAVTYYTQHRKDVGTLTGIILSSNDPEVAGNFNSDGTSNILMRTYFIKSVYPNGGSVISKFRTPKVHQVGDRLQVLVPPGGPAMIQRFTLTDGLALFVVSSAILGGALLSRSKT